MAPSLKFRNLVVLAVWLAMFGLVPTSCVRSDKNEAAKQPVSDDVSSISVDEPSVQITPEAATVETSPKAEANITEEHPAETLLTQEAQPSAEAGSEPTEKADSVPSAPTDQPIVETAQESSTDDVPSEKKTDTAVEDSAEIVLMEEAKHTDLANDSTEKANSVPASPADRPVVETARASSKSRVTNGRSARIVSMRQVQHSVDPKDFDINAVAGGEPIGATSASKKPSFLLSLMHRLAMFFIEMDPRARLVPSDERPAFSPDPVYTGRYDAEAQLAIYGAKHPNPTARPLIEAGRELYGPGTFEPGINLLGNKNLIFPQLLMYGDERTAVAYNDNGAIEKGLIATRLNLDVDLKLTGTERIHLFITPLQRGPFFTRAEFAGDRQHSGVEIDFEPQALFFEGDLGRLMAGFSDEENHIDMPFTFGLIPLLFQNGIWLQDAFDGFAITIPARNSPALGITNADITFFAGFDQVTTGAIPNDHAAQIVGIAAFVEAASGYFEFDYGYTNGRKNFSDLNYHNFSAAFTRRYFDTISNSVRVIYNFGQDPENNHRRTADGVLLLLENSLITPKPLTLVPYLDLFAGFNKPQSLARAGAAGGVLLNTGILFESDNLTGFPTMDATGHDTYGGSLGLEYLFDLHQQIVFEVSALGVMGDAKDRTAKGSQVGFGIRYQLPLNNAWLLRADLMVASRENDQDLFGIRGELRRKF